MKYIEDNTNAMSDIVKNSSDSTENLLNRVSGECFSKLNTKESLFCRNYILNGGNATAACEAMGIKKITAYAAGSRLMVKPQVAEAIKNFKEMLVKDSEYTLAKCIAENQSLLETAIRMKQMTAVSKFAEMKYKMTGHLVDKMSLDLNVKGNFIVQTPRDVSPPPYAIDVTPVKAALDAKKKPDGD